MLITALGRQVCSSPGLPGRAVERDKGLCTLPFLAFLPPLNPVPPPVGAAFLPPRAAAAPGRISPPAPPRAAPSRPRRAAEGGIGGGRGVGAERKIKKGGGKTNTHPQKSQVSLLPDPPSPPSKLPSPVRLHRVGEAHARSRDARVGRCRDTHGPSRPFTHVRTRGDTRGESLSRTHREKRLRVRLGAGGPDLTFEVAEDPVQVLLHREPGHGRGVDAGPPRMGTAERSGAGAEQRIGPGRRRLPRVVRERSERRRRR